MRNCKRPTAIWVLGLLIVALMAPSAYAGIGFSVTPTFPTPQDVGNMNIPGALTITAAITNPNDTNTVLIDPASIQLNPACVNNSCTEFENPGAVVTINAAGITTSGDCSGVNFTLSGPGADGFYTFNQDADFPIVNGQSCTINFTWNVLAVPATDANLGAAGIQTRQVGRISATDQDNNDEGTGTGSSQITIDFSCDVSIDKQLTDNGTTVDALFVMEDEDGAGLLTLIGSDNYTANFLARNDGNLDLSCTLRDLHQSNLDAVIIGDTPFDVPVGFQDILTFRTNACTDFEGIDRYELECTCDAGVAGMVSPGSTGDNIITEPVIKFDRAEVACVNCEVGIEKEVSCNFDDAEPTWAESCVAPTGGAIASRVIVTNLGDADVTCSVNDSDFGLVVDGETVAVASSSTTVFGQGECVERQQNTASLVDCFCDGVPAVLNPEQDSAQIDCCSVELTKEVSCGPDENGQITFGDGCTGWNDLNEPVTGRFTPANTGTVGVICDPETDPDNFPSDGITDNVEFLLSGAVAVNNGDILPAGETGTPVEDTALCDPDGLHEDTGTLNCLCLDAEDNPTELRVSDTDPSNFTCQTPGLSVSKVCDPQTDTQNAFSITVENTGTADLANCTINDAYFTDVEICPALTEPVEGNEMTAATDPATIPLLLPGDPAVVATGTIEDLASQACNTAVVTCEIVGAFEETGEPKTVTAEGRDECEVGEDNCITRTPGFWGTHPAITGLFLPLESCGVEITHTLDGIEGGEGSATEDMCSVGLDPKLNEVFDHQVQLERQCMAANLNVAASAANDLSCDAALPGTDDMLAECCNAETSVCRSALEPGQENIDGRSIEGCIDALDAFNNNETEEPEETPAPFDMPGPADPSECRDSKNNGFLNDRPRAENSKGGGPGPSSQGKKK